MPPRTTARRMSAGVILVDREGRVLMQLRDDDPKIMFPGHWGLTGGAAQPDETPEQTARREVQEETGLILGRIEPFRAYYFNDAGARTEGPVAAKAEGQPGAPAAPRPRARPATARTEYELYLFHAPCETPAEDLACGEGRELRFLAPEEIEEIPVAYNHREVLADFFGSPLYARYLSGEIFGGDAPVDPVAHFRGELAAGVPWFDALMDAIALWERPEEVAGERRYRYLVGGEAFDWLLLAERLLDAVPEAAPALDVERLLFAGVAPKDANGGAFNDERLRALVGETKHRAHLNYIYGVTVEEALQYATELQIAKERGNVAIRDLREADAERDPIFERIYGRPRRELLTEFRTETHLPDPPAITLSELREFSYWLFKYRVKNQEPARVASDTRKALAQLSAMEAGVRAAGRRP